MQLVRALKSAGCRVTVCCYYQSDPIMVREMEGAGAELLLMGLHRRDGNLRLIWRLRRLFRQRHPDVVHVQYLAPGLVPILAARLAGVPSVFATVHQPGRTYGWRPKLLLRIAACLSSHFFCNSRAVEASWFGSSALFNPDRPRRRSHSTIYNAVDLPEIAGASTDAGAASLRRALGVEGRVVVGVVGRLRWEKGQGVLLDAMAAVVKQVPCVLLLVAGDGPDRKDLQLRAEQMGVGDHVRWLGQLGTVEVLRLYHIMDVVAVPSIFEGFGLAAAEAMAAGLPVVCSAVDGLEELVVDRETGLLVPARDPAALAQALIALLLSPKEAVGMGLRGRERVAELFSLPRYCDALRAAYAAFTQAGDEENQ